MEKYNDYGHREEDDFGITNSHNPCATQWFGVCGDLDDFIFYDEDVMIENDDYSSR